MLTAYRKICAAGLATGLMLSSSALAQGVNIGVNAVVRNDVTLQSEGAVEARQAMPAEAVYLRDVVRSGDDATLQILLNDETVFTVGENADMVIDEFVYDPAVQSGSLSASVRKGTFRFMSGKIAQTNPDQVRINAPMAYIGVRGTVLDVVVGADAIAGAQASGIDAGSAVDGDATLVILRGPGRGQNGLNKDGGAYINSGGDETTLWKSGTAVFVPRAGGQIFGPFRFADSVFFSVAGQLGTGPDGSNALPPRDLRPVIRELPDLRDIHRPPPGGPGKKPCPGECPNNQEDGFGQDTGR